MRNARRTWIGLAAIALIALLVVVLPNGGVAVAMINDTVRAAFLVLLGYALIGLYRNQSEWLSSLSERDRVIVYAAISVGTLAIVGVDRFRDLWNGGIVLVILILAACGGAIFWVWDRSRRWSI